MRRRARWHASSRQAEAPAERSCSGHLPRPSHAQAATPAKAAKKGRKGGAAAAPPPASDNELQLEGLLAVMENLREPGAVQVGRGSSAAATCARLLLLLLRNCQQQDSRDGRPRRHLAHTLPHPTPPRALQSAPLDASTTADLVDALGGRLPLLSDWRELLDALLDDDRCGRAAGTAPGPGLRAGRPGAPAQAPPACPAAGLTAALLPPQV